MTTNVAAGSVLEEVAPKTGGTPPEKHVKIRKAQKFVAQANSRARCESGDFGPSEIPEMVGRGDNLCTFQVEPGSDTGRTLTLKNEDLDAVMLRFGYEPSTILTR